jgi:hypothetical protein
MQVTTKVLPTKRVKLFLFRTESESVFYLSLYSNNFPFDQQRLKGKERRMTMRQNGMPFASRVSLAIIHARQEIDTTDGKTLSFPFKGIPFG